MPDNSLFGKIRACFSIKDKNKALLDKIKVRRNRNKNEKIDLLRNTSLSLFKESILGEMLSEFNADSNEDINIGKLQTIVQGPALLIIPIAIYL